MVRWCNDQQVRDARAVLRKAQAELDANARHESDRHIDYETAEFHRLNKVVHEAQQNLRDSRP